MSNDTSVLVWGIGEAASATARALFSEGYDVALYRSTAPLLLRRRMSFADAWYDGYAQLDCVEARRADVNVEFTLGFQTREFIPLLRGQLDDVLERWPWDVIVVAKEDREPLPAGLRGLAELTIGLGRDFSSGVDCHLAIEIEGSDPGAVIGEGEARRKRTSLETGDPQHALVRAPAAGLFTTQAPIGASIEAGTAIGSIGDIRIAAPTAGRIKGLARREQAVIEGTPVAEIAIDPTAQVAGVSNHNQLVARGVSFTIEMENAGIEPFSFENWR